MNLTIEQFLSGLERSVRELPVALGKWADIDEDLRAEYVDQLTWMLERRWEILVAAERANQLGHVATRLAMVSVALRRIAPALREHMGIDLNRADLRGAPSGA